MSVLLKNNAASNLSVAISARDQFIKLGVGHGARFPQPSSTGDWFPLTLQNDSGKIEIVHAKARTGDEIKVKRGAEDTVAIAFSAGDTVELRLTVAALLELTGHTQP